MKSHLRNACTVILEDAVSAAAAAELTNASIVLANPSVLVILSQITQKIFQCNAVQFNSRANNNLEKSITQITENYNLH